MSGLSKRLGVTHMRKHFENKALSYLLLWAILVIGSMAVLALHVVVPG